MVNGEGREEPPLQCGGGTSGKPFFFNDLHFSAATV
jgi:hypothetical protein